MNPLLTWVIAILTICGICAIGVLFVERRDKRKKQNLVKYQTGDKLTVFIRQGEHSTTYNKATIISKDEENPNYFYCEVIYPDLYEEPLERVCYTQISRNLSLERREAGL